MCFVNDTYVHVYDQILDIHLTTAYGSAGSATLLPDSMTAMRFVQIRTHLPVDANLVLLLHRSALHLAARGGQAGALKALLEDLDEEERVAFLNDPDKNGITPVFLAKQKGEAGYLSQSFPGGGRGGGIWLETRPGRLSCMPDIIRAENCKQLHQ